MSIRHRTDLHADAMRLDEFRIGRSATVVDIYTDEYTPVAVTEAKRLAQLGEWAAANERTDVTPSQQLSAAAPFFGSGGFSAPSLPPNARMPSRPPPAPPRRTASFAPGARSSTPPPPPARTTGRSAVPAALARSSTVSKADALLPEMANDPHYYPGLIPSAQERAQADSESPEFRRPLPRWVWHVGAGVGLFLAGLAVASFRSSGDTHSQTSTSAIQAAPVENAAPTPPPAAAEPAPATATDTASAEANAAASDNAFAPKASDEPTKPLSAREVAKQHRAERRAERLARYASHKGHASGSASTKTSTKSTSSFGSAFGGASSASVSKTKGKPSAAAAMSGGAASGAASGGKTGTLQINSRPWADIYVDNKLVGHTPQMGLPLSAGHHTIKLTNPAMGLTKTLSITIHAGETVKKIETLGG